MKKIISVILTLCLVIAGVASAENTNEDVVQGDFIFRYGEFLLNYSFSTSRGEGMIVVGLTEEGKEKEVLEIPSEVNGIKVVKVNGEPFVDSKCKKIILPEGIRQVGPFSLNDNLESINLENTYSLKNADLGSAYGKLFGFAYAGCFTGCSNLKYIGPKNQLPKKYWDAGVFSESGLEYVTINSDCFGTCDGTAEAVNKVHIFYGCKQLRTANFTDSVHRIGGPNFKDSALDYVTFGTGLTWVSHGIFSDCANLRTAVFYGPPVTLSNKKEIGMPEDKQYPVFEGCERLTIIGRKPTAPKNSEDTPYSYNYEEYAEAFGIKFIPAIINDGEPSTVVAQADQTATVWLNGYEIPAYTVNGSVYVGESALKSFGFGMDWDGDTRTTTITKPENVQWSVELNTNPEPYSLDVYSSDVKFMMNGFPIPYLCVGYGESIVDVNAIAEAVLY